MELDLLTKFLKQALDTLILSSPFKTCMGVILGVALEGFSVLQPQLEPVPWYAWISICVFIINLDNLFKRARVSSRSQKVLGLIEGGRKSGLISSEEAKQRFRLLIQKELDTYEQGDIRRKRQIE